MIRARRIAAAVGGVALSCSTVAVAHGGHAEHRTWGPLALFGGGVVLLGASVYLDANDATARGHADAGVALGLLAVLAGVALYWF